jgi:hypothetical protein
MRRDPSRPESGDGGLGIGALCVGGLFGKTALASATIPLAI